jgi:2,4-dienoyl-CoA reductase-like NADH-dependent reductase (Old Yellow Enzyme family)
MAKNLFPLRYAKEKYPRTFSSLNIKNVTLPNRIVFPPWVVNYATPEGAVSGELAYFYRRLARGGAGLIYVGAAGIAGEIPPGYEGVIRIDKDEYIPGLETLFDMMKGFGCCVALQLAHMGRQAAGPGPGADTLIAPSNIPDPVIAERSPIYKLREMTSEDIERVRGQFVDAAYRGVQAGAQIIEFHAAHGYLLHNFLSNRTNRRKDAYGGTLEKRTRFIREILEQTRERVGDDAVMSVRISAKDFLDGGLEPDDYETIIPILEGAGLDLLNVSVGTQTESLQWCMPGKKLGEAPNVNIIAQIKKYTSLPVITVGSIGSLATAESILAENKADLVAIGRSQVADQDFVKKSAKGMEEKIRKCIRCNRCCFWMHGENRMHCAVNPDYKKKSKQSLSIHS